MYNDRLRWYCCHTEYQQEYVAAKHLSQQGFPTYLPLMLINTKQGREVVPLFSRYLFVQFSRKSHWQPIPYTVGVKALLGFTKLAPTPLDDLVVETLMEAASLYEDGKILLPGASVIFKKGEWAGSTAVCEWSNSTRVELLMRILGKEVNVIFNRQKLEEVL